MSQTPLAPGGGGAGTAVATPPPAEEPRQQGVLRRLFQVIPPIWVVFAVLMALIVWRTPSFAEPGPVLAFLKQGTPLMILALGQMFVIVSGEFDLSVGALVTVTVIVAARLIDGVPGRVWPVIALLFALGLLVGLVNGLITTRLHVPSFITTLGMLFVLNGAVFLWSGGSPRGSLPPEFRRFGRLGITGVPGIREIPYSVLILLVVAAAAVVTLRRSRFGYELYATGGNPRAAAMSGVNVANVRTAAFVVSALSAVLAGVLVGGFGGISAQAGASLEFQAITAVVLGGVLLGGGRGTAGMALGGALTLQASFKLLNLLGLQPELRDTVAGVTIIAAGAYASYRLRAQR